MDDVQQPVVLIVDDQRLIADTLEIVLKKNGYVATTCYSGEDAIAILPKLKPHIVSAT